MLVNSLINLELVAVSVCLRRSHGRSMTCYSGSLYRGCSFARLCEACIGWLCPTSDVLWSDIACLLSCVLICDLCVRGRMEVYYAETSLLYEYPFFSESPELTQHCSYCL